MRTLTISCSLVLLAATVSAAASPVMYESLRGTVYAADGSPGIGAVVWAAKVNHGPLERRETIADANGRYVLNLDSGTWRVWARRGAEGGEGPARHEPVKVVTGQAPEPVTIRLEERGSLRGRLFEAETGKPLVGGQVFLDAGLVLTTDSDGHFEVGGLSRGSHESFIVAAGRMRMRVLFDTTARVVTELDVPVPRTARIVGRVTDSDGNPIPGAYVGRHTSGSHFSLNGLYSSCDGKGRFEYDDVSPADQPTRLAAAAPGYVEEERHGLIVPADGKPLELHFRLSPKPSDRPDARAPADERRRLVSGVVRGPDGTPVSGILVRWGYQPYVGAVETRTDDAGQFRVTVADEANMLAVLPSNFKPDFLKIGAGGDQKVEVTLRAGRVGRGRILDDTGKPIKDVQVIAVITSPDPRIGNPYWLSEAAVRSDADGAFELKGVPHDARFDFLKAGLSDVRNHSLDLAKADNTIVMQHGGAIHGRVVDRDGKPIRNFRVLIGIPPDHGPHEKVGGYFAGYSGIGVRFTSDDGSFVLTELRAGYVHRVSILAEGHGEAVVDRVKAMPTNRLGITDSVELRAGPPVALRVRVSGDNAKSITGARITLVNGEVGLDESFMWGYHDASWEDMVRARTGVDGWAHFSALTFGGATVLVQAPGYARQRSGWRNGQSDLKFELVPEAVVIGEVRDGAGRPMKAFHVTLASGGDQISTTVGPDDKGWFDVGELRAGKWTVIVRDADGRSTLHQQQLSLSAGETKVLMVDTKRE